MGGTLKVGGFTFVPSLINKSHFRCALLINGSVALGGAFFNNSLKEKY
ncbi:MAG: hypothetical protein M3142_07030 [Bacteroidota bacterium]|nr:hypothetical protein [Bacteroidota bacterium]